MTAQDVGAVGDAVDEIEEQLLVALRRGRRVAREAAEKVHPGLEPAAYAFLVRLDAVGPSRPSDLAAYFHIGKATAGRQLTALQALGLIARQPDPEDGRAYLLDLTPDGRQRLSACRADRQRSLRERLGAWPEADLATLAALLVRLNNDAGGD
ncbi:MarR family winged helix-turn-helix transcriptional regulator [Nocardia sp. alder85J]|uniref:MarR family winged helix-turn-helix transcriptional regulator n=1 Tax=Nocardia sp. alder85J TaxID=2862949 RepID=UPI001CD1E0EE|nr:MarR family transcriptional regulator [Nocardia sp. alder85J]MCX4094307.1 MarR family transcriptional regulator [Nocardia sp. alder85J]